ncbi:hypothetical protein [Methanobacterium sp.]|uniref:hypothetical protein n=1 Tax=Methanobacterium sp. TaxID=2164 RepID=UPI0025F8B125|nr:hypothetical protein [Methanobacterium sp.]MBI5459004.1 hypothetical protein [Methanobacterium sp.]
MNKTKKAALICAMVMMISIVPVFALNDTSNNTTDENGQYQYGQDNGNAGSGNCGNCDGEHKYMCGQKNGNAGSGNCGNCQGMNCNNAS